MYPFLREPRVLGLGEVMNYPGVLYKDQKLLDKIAIFRDAARPVDGHAPGLSGGALSAYIAAALVRTMNARGPRKPWRRSRRVCMYAARGIDRPRSPEASAGGEARRPHRISSSARRPASERLVDEGHMDHALRFFWRRSRSVRRLPHRLPQSAPLVRSRGSGGSLGLQGGFRRLDSLEDFRPILVFKDGVIVAEQGRLVADTPSGPAHPRLGDING
jgi:adenine deaminase